MSIPKIIHWGVFGGWQLSDLNHRCMDTWRSKLPDYEIRRWDDSNGPQDKPFFVQACKERPILASNYLKYWALLKYGGIFMDNDVEVLRPFDLSHRAFIAFQRDDMDQDCINTAVLGSEPGHPFIQKCVDRLDADNVGAWPVWCGCGLPTEELRNAGMTGLNVEQDVAGVHVYEKSAFYPWRHDEKIDPARVTAKTFAIHWMEGTWMR